MLLSTDRLFYHLKAAVSSSSQVYTLSVAETVPSMIVYYTGRLHIRIHNDGSGKSETSFLHVLAQFVRSFSACWNIMHRTPIILDCLAVDEAPYIVGKTSPLFLNSEKGSSVLARPIHLEAIAHYFGVQQHFIELFIAITGDFFGIKIVKQVTIAIPLA